MCHRVPVTNRIVELHDSRIEKMERRGGNLFIEFSHAYVHESLGIPGVSSGTGWSYRATLILYQVPGGIPVLNWPFEILDGDLCVGGVEHPNEIPVPFVSSLTIELQLSGLDDTEDWQEIRLTGQGGRLDLKENPRFIEEFRGQNTEQKAEKDAVGSEMIGGL